MTYCVRLPIEHLCHVKKALSALTQRSNSVATLPYLQLKKKIIEVYLIHSVVLVSAVQQSKSVIYEHSVESSSLCYTVDSISYLFYT